MTRPRTIWAEDALPLVQSRFRPIFWVMLPLFDLLVVLFAVGAWLIGSRVVEENTLPWFHWAWAFLIAVGAVSACVGLVFQLDRVEVTGKVCLVISFAAYMYLLIVEARFGALSAYLTVIVTCGFLLPPLFRIFDLVGEIARRPKGR